MGILSLSTENKDKLLQLIESLQEVFEQKDILAERAEPFVKRMNAITLEKETLDKKLEKYDATNFKSVADITDLSNIILKSKQLDDEIDNINESSKTLNIEFNEIINQENEIVSKIKELLELSSNNNNQINESILIEKLGINVLVFKPEVPDVVSVVDRGSDEIINCGADIVKSLSEVYFQNSIEVTKKVDKDDFKKLEKYFLACKMQKEQSIDERIAFIKKDNDIIDSEEKTKIEEEPISLNVSTDSEEINSVPEIINYDSPISTKKVENSIGVEGESKIEINSEPKNLDMFVQSNEINDNININEPEAIENNILSLDRILHEKSNKETEKKDLNIITIKNRFDNSYSKVANSNIEKLQNIINNFKGKFIVPIIKSEIANNIKTKPIDPISSFINPEAAL